MTSRVTPKLCGLRLALGERELCPGAECVLWDGGCELELLHVPVLEHRDLARHLLELRLAAESTRDEAERADAYRRFGELRNLNRD